MQGFTPTAQQLSCINAAINHDAVVIEAVAGSSKTTTLTLIAKEIKEKSLYLAFNKSAADDARKRFPAHVDCRTQHSVAYEVMGHRVAHKLNRPSGAYVNVGGTGSELARMYGLSGVDGVITAAALGVLVKDTVACYEQSADATLDYKHLPMREIHSYEKKGYLKISKDVMRAAKKLWKDRINPDSKVLATHDTYLKLFQLSNPVLPYQRIYLDECQDSSECVFDIFMKQPAKKVMVGDSRQQIYQWRGSTNVLEKVDFHVENLSKSFRFGNDIAQVAAKILKGKVVIEGYEKLEAKVGQDVVDTTKPYAVLYRTNSALILEAIDALEDGKKIYLKINTRDFCNLITSAKALFNRDMKNVKHERVIPYATWEDLIEDCEEDRELKRVAALVTGYRADKVVSLLTAYIPPDNPDIIFTTAHGSKGLEYDQVIVANDFPSHYNSNGEWKGLHEAEENLLYVAHTRAKSVLQYNTTALEAIEFMSKQSINLI